MQTFAPKPVLATRSAAGLNALRTRWPEYLMEAAALGAFMISACIFAVLMEHPVSPIHQALLTEPLTRRVVMGVAMGLTALGIIYSPWGQRSGAHMNPAVTLTFLTLGKVAPWDALFYILSQFLGGTTGVVIAADLIGPPLQHSAVNYIATMPGPSGPVAAFLAEFLISMQLMSTILWTSNSPRWSRFTPFFAAALVATFVTVEAPLSGTSMNPARSLGSAVSADEWTGLWIYFTAPTLAMLLAAVLYRFQRNPVFCAKLHHSNQHRCIFKCRYDDLYSEERERTRSLRE